MTLGDEIDELTAIAESCTVNTDKDCVQTSNSGDKLSVIVGRILECEKKLRILKAVYTKTLNTVYLVTDTIDDKQVREFISVRYVQENGLYKTAEKMDIPDSTVKRLQKKSQIEFAKAYTKCYPTDQNHKI